MLSKFFRYYHTLKYLKPVQIYGRILNRYRRPVLDPFTKPPERRKVADWVAPIHKPNSLVGPRRFVFLQKEGTVGVAADWNRSDVSRLWLYNLHYFDFLGAQGAAMRTEAQALIHAWIEDNPVGHGTGWDPYPTALRIVNWIKWIWAGGQADDTMLSSLATQAEWLSRRIEHHLQGNHLLADAKGLVFAGVFFAGPRARHWLDTGLKLLMREVQEQILPDGGHYERSPMYHTVIFEDLLDLYNLLGPHQNMANDWATLAEVIPRMGHWLRALLHPDGQIALFNDAAFEIAPHPEAVFDYAARLGFSLEPKSEGALQHLEQSGFVRVVYGKSTALLEVKGPGPAYIPGHAHAGTLGFEWSLGRQRVLVDSGTSTYDWGEARKRQRSTAAHNTLTVDGRDSSEVWGSHRVARRAYNRQVTLSQDEADGTIVVMADHDGYTRLPGVGLHKRTWRFQEGGLSVVDEILGSGRHQVALHWHFHPEVKPPENGRGPVAGPGGLQVEMDRALKVTRQEYPYHPRFGEAVAAHKLVAQAEVTLPQHFETRFRWSPT